MNEKSVVSCIRAAVLEFNCFPSETKTDLALKWGFVLLMLWVLLFPSAALSCEGRPSRQGTTLSQGQVMRAGLCPISPFQMLCSRAVAAKACLKIQLDRAMLEQWMKERRKQDHCSCFSVSETCHFLRSCACLISKDVLYQHGPPCSWDAGMVQ